MGDVFSNTLFWAQILGFLGFMCSATAWQLKNPRHIMLMYVPSGLFWSSHYFLLGGLTAVFILILSAIKDICVALLPNKFVAFIILSFLAAISIFTFFSYAKFIDILPLLAMFVLNLPRLDRENRPLIARGFIASQFLWLMYNISVGSIPGIISGTVLTGFCLFGMARHEEWQLGKCYRTFFPSLVRSLFPNLRTYP
ncbi:MAG: YgjV family protein [Pseudomonadota bacterium]